MAKNALFLVSIGCLLFVLSVDSQTANYNLFKMITGLVLIISGMIFLFKQKKRNKTG